MTTTGPAAAAATVVAIAQAAHDGPRFGWCATGHHDACRYEVGGTQGISTCSCPCHEEDE